MVEGLGIRVAKKNFLTAKLTKPGGRRFRCIERIPILRTFEPELNGAIFDLVGRHSPDESIEFFHKP
jgi:hypothetical protein